MCLCRCVATGEAVNPKNLSLIERLMGYGKLYKPHAGEQYAVDKSSDDSTPEGVKGMDGIEQPAK